ncbi:Sec-independent protein translocase protein TatB [Stenoxybacter acetivorans]|uniref:Sec-independent protein translocase protein TatB n=1 Tax=Stenoxybacter acetivorans TaxID=422441 RepID=UPI000561B81E|nr:Sec-independent protein translocase protein TatB [Stenoxybacter acetivorans]
MFDLGFSELMLIAVIALVVLGPERLPKVARAAGLWVGRVQRFVSHVKTELSTQSGVAEFKDVRDSVAQTARAWQHDWQQHAQELQQGLDMRPAWERLPPQRTPEDFQAADDHSTNPLPLSIPYSPPIHSVSLRRQSIQRKRDVRPRRQITPKLRARRHSSNH